MRNIASQYHSFDELILQCAVGNLCEFGLPLLIFQLDLPVAN